MDSNQPQKKFRDYNEYISSALKFYDLKDESLTPIIFVGMLVISFGTTFLSHPTGKTDMKYIITNLLVIAAVQLASAVYLTAYIRERRGKEYSLEKCVRIVMKRLLPIILVTVLYFVGLILGLVLLVVPGIIFSVIFLFSVCYVVDLGEGVLSSFTASKNLTRGRRLRIFGIIFIFNIVLFIPVLFILLTVASSRNALVQNFVLSFVTTVLNLMQQRLTGMLYVDLEYGIPEKESGPV